VVYSEGNCDWFKSSELRQGNNREETAKMNRAFNAGAKAVILVTTPKDRNNST